MAAPIHKLLSSNILSFCARRRHPTLTPRHRHATTCTYVLLPEVPPDTAETNTLMDINNLPEWSKVTSSSVYRACGKLAIQFETKLADHCEKLQDLGQAASFDDVFLPIEEVSVPLQNAYRSIKHLSTVKKKTFSDAFEGVYKHVHRSRAERLHNEILFHRIKELNANPDALTESQQSLVTKYLRDIKLAGASLSGKEQLAFQDQMKNLVKCQDEFRRSVFFSSKAFNHTVYDDQAVSEMPSNIRNRLSFNRDSPEQGPWRFGVDSASFHRPVLDYCPNRELRKLVWTNLVSIASVQYAGEGHSTKNDMLNIRTARRSMAQLLGYNSYAEMAMEHRMAGSVENVMEFIETLRSAFQPEAQEELDQLHKYASSQGFSETIQMWDINYWSRRQRYDLYQVDLAEPSEYFPLPRVLHGMFQICQGLFGVEVKRRESGSVDVWHPSVEVFDLFDENGVERGTFYIDPYVRLGQKYGGGWVDFGRERSVLYKGKPTSFLNLNLNPTIGKKPSLMSLKDVLMLFSMMGHTLQQLLTTVDYSEVAGQSNIESDAVNVSSSFFTMWLMRPDTLRSLSCHWETNEQISSDQVEAFISSYNHMFSNRLMKRLFYSVYDLEMYFSERHFDTAVRQLWPRYMLQPLDAMYMEPFSMVNVFCDSNQASGVYGPLWSEMVASDVMKSFNECANMEELQTTGRRFRDTVLSLGGSVPASEVFRRFKGHDPSVNSLIQLKLPHQQLSE